MTIIIPTWLVVLLICMFVFNSVHRTRQLVKGAKAVWPSIKVLLDPDKKVDIKVTKTIGDEDSSTR